MSIAHLVASLTFIAAGLISSFATAQLAPAAKPFPYGTKALVMIDMQDEFATRDNYNRLGVNPEKIKAVIEKQKIMIALAKNKKMPILVAEYQSFGPTNSELMTAIGNYAWFYRVVKTTDGLFDNANSSVAETKSKLAEWGIDSLILMGANGGACVEATMKGAISSGYKVWAYTSGIADFNYENFIYPYFYEQNLRDFKTWKDLGLKEYDQPVQFVNLRYRKKAALPPLTLQPEQDSPNDSDAALDLPRNQKEVPLSF